MNRPAAHRYHEALLTEILDVRHQRLGDAVLAAQAAYAARGVATITRAGTETGVILGTAAYMSPEQARGKAVGKR